MMLENPDRCIWLSRPLKKKNSDFDRITRKLEFILQAATAVDTRI